MKKTKIKSAKTALTPSALPAEHKISYGAQFNYAERFSKRLRAIAKKRAETGETPAPKVSINNKTIKNKKA